MTPPLAGLHHVALTVTDLDVSAAWYAGILGLVEQFREDSPTRRAAVFHFPGGGHSVGLVEHVGTTRAMFDPTVTGLDHLARNWAPGKWNADEPRMLDVLTG